MREPQFRSVFFAIQSLTFYNNIFCQVSTQYKKEINVKIQGSGIGGCDILMENGQTNNDCWCLWGTINYSFCVYTKNGMNDVPQIANNTTVGNGKCPVVTGESLVCNDLSSLGKIKNYVFHLMYFILILQFSGNCYDKAYSCNVDDVGLCHCQTV